jgi:hypothetical protein
MGSTRSHPLPPGIFVEMPPPTNQELIEEIKRLRVRIKELESKKVTRVDDNNDDDDDIMHDHDVREMVENGEHTCHMFDAHCQACEDDEEEEDEDEEYYNDEVRVLTEEEVLNDPEMTQSAAIQRVDELRAHFC